MAKEAALKAEKRLAQGSAACRRLRNNGLVPGVVYGHDADPLAIQIAEEDLRPVADDGVKVVDVSVDGRVDKALVREIQWNLFTGGISHFDLMRVDPNERVTLTIPIELKGIAPGTLAGGVLEQPMHTIVIDCLTYQIPDSIVIRINSLELNQAIHVRDLQLPEGAHPHAPADAIVVHVIHVHVREVEAAALPGEPEVVGKKPAEGDDAAPAAGGKK